MVCSNVFTDLVVNLVDLGCDEDSSKKNMLNNDNNEELDGLGVYRVRILCLY